jgi:hypothetical protein
MRQPSCTLYRSATCRRAIAKLGAPALQRDGTLATLCQPAIRATAVELPGPTPRCRLKPLARRSGVGHEERFPPTRLSAGCGFRKETIAGMRRNGRDAPIPALCT